MNKQMSVSFTSSDLCWKAHFFAHYLFVLMLLLADVTHSKVHYYITPSQNDSCPQYFSCLTLSQLTADSSNYYKNEIDITLIFQPGNHTIDRELSLTDGDNFTMIKDAQGSGTVNIECFSHSGRFDVNGTVFTSIKGLHFIGCEGNTVTQVKQFILEDTAFQGAMLSGTALVLNEVGSASIVRTSFTNLGSKFQNKKFISSLSSEEVMDYVFLKLDMTTRLSGALYTAFSNVSIFNCKFVHNRADVGGALFAHSSSLSITGSTYSYNRANFGGVLVVSESSVVIDNSTFSDNTAEVLGGVMMAYKNISGRTFTNNDSIATNSGDMNSSKDFLVTIADCTFTNNRATRGGVMETYGESLFTVSTSTFSNNSANDGGVMRTFHKSSFNIFNCRFTNNSAAKGGVMVTRDESSFIITETSFTDNRANDRGGGVMCTYGQSSFNITNSRFTNNMVYFFPGGGVILIKGKSAFTIISSSFINNSAMENGGGGVMNTFYECSLTIINSNFTNNSAAYGGVMRTFTKSSLTIVSSTFSINRATVSGGVMAAYSISSFNIISCTFTDNSATFSGGVIFTSDYSSFTDLNSTFTHNSAAYGGVVSIAKESSLNIASTHFTNNSATNGGGVLWCTGGSFDIDNSRFISNSASSYGGTMFTSNCSIHIDNCIFDNNLRSLYAFNSNLTFSGCTKIENGIDPLTDGDVNMRQEGGAITSFQSTVIFTGAISLLNNQASCGGAILATESKITIYGETCLVNNVATNGSGGGMSLQQSVLEIIGNCIISNNQAMIGGGIHATSSTIAVHQPGILDFTRNKADYGSGLYLEVNPKLYLMKTSTTYVTLLYFIGNHANYEGALYVADDTNSGACSPHSECFIQTLALHQNRDFNFDVDTVNMQFSGNTATGHESDIFGGLLDRCIPSPFAEVYLKQSTHYSGATYLGNISNILLDSVTSLPVRICFCPHKGLQPDCSYKPPPIRAQKGYSFTVSLVAVDQVNHTVVANIISSLSSSNGGFGEGQQTQRVGSNCTELKFNVFSPYEFETITMYADGPCGSAMLSTSHVTIQFVECTCPVGFEPLSNSRSPTRCECVCDSKLSPYITNCNSNDNSLQRVNTNSWITYINDTESPGYVIHPNCPFDYCQPQTKNVTINFNYQKGADKQCAYNRTGVLCGSCQHNLSLSLSSSRCLPCRSYWPASLAGVLLAAIIAGIILIVVMLALNVTVAVGIINGFIFYANIVAASNTIFIRSSEASFPSVFVAWLNFDIGIDVCFFNGLDAYTKIWLQLAFPVYIISLVITVIIISEYSPRFVRLIGKRDPVATLATLILLSYAKLLSVTITALSFGVLHYPNGSQEHVWLPDGNVKFFQGKHIPLSLVALLIILIGIPYTILLFLWQWIVHTPHWKIFKWTRNTKLNAFIATYHAPYNNKHRYWTGLLLLVRVVLYITASVTVSANPQTLPLTTGILVGGLFLLKGVIGVRVYKKSLVEIVNTVLYFNLLVLAFLSLYNFKSETKKQTAAAYTSTIITFVILIGAIFYHVTLLITFKKKTILQSELNEHLLAPLQSAKAKVTHSVIELPKRQYCPKIISESDDLKVIETATVTYQ